MPVIRVDDEVWAWLKAQAQPFEDTPNSVLRRVAGFDSQTESGGHGIMAPRRRRVGPREEGRKTPQHEYREPILRILRKHGGRADRTRVLQDLEKAFGDRLTDFDRQDIKSGSIRWQKTAEWEVSTMRQQGLLLSRTDSPHGVWCLSPTGEDAARKL